MLPVRLRQPTGITTASATQPIFGTDRSRHGWCERPGTSEYNNLYCLEPKFAVIKLTSSRRAPMRFFWVTCCTALLIAPAFAACPDQDRPYPDICRLDQTKSYDPKRPSRKDGYVSPACAARVDAEIAAVKAAFDLAPDNVQRVLPPHNDLYQKWRILGRLGESTLDGLSRAGQLHLYIGRRIDPNFSCI